MEIPAVSPWSLVSWLCPSCRRVRLTEEELVEHIRFRLVTSWSEARIYMLPLRTILTFLRVFMVKGWLSSVERISYGRPTTTKTRLKSKNVLVRWLELCLYGIGVEAWKP